MDNIEFRTPLSFEEYKKYNLFKWKILRKPIGKSINSLKDDFEDSSYHLIALKNNIIIACGRLHFNSYEEAQIRYMAVEKIFQGKGIGKQILRLLEARAIKENAVKIIINARDHVLNFYKKSGYKIVSKFDGSDTGIPHTTMEKKI